MFREFIDSMIRAWIRFWDGRFVSDNHIEFYRLTIERLEVQNKRLTEQIIELSRPRPELTQERINPEDMISMQRKVPFSVKRRELEAESRKRLAEIRVEASKAIKPSNREPIGSEKQSVEELEAELGLDDASNQ